jgi:hypothetical protein
MPYEIIKLPASNLYKVINTHTKRIHSRHTTLAVAKRQVRLLMSLDKKKIENQD